MWTWLSCCWVYSMCGGLVSSAVASRARVVGVGHGVYCLFSVAGRGGESGACMCNNSSLETGKFVVAWYMVLIH